MVDSQPLEDPHATRIAPRVSVIIPTHRRPEALARVLGALAKQTFPPNDFEILVVMDGPCAETQHLLENITVPSHLKWFTQAWRGVSAARNLGVREARGELLAFLDDDIIPGPDWLAVHVRGHARGEVVFSGYQQAPDSPGLFVGEATDWSLKHLIRCSRPGYEPEYEDLPAGNMSILKRHLDAVGGWDEQFEGYGGEEDQELGMRLVSSGLRLYFEPAALVHHYQVKSWRRYLQDQRVTGRAHRILISKHPEEVRVVTFAAWSTDAWWKRFIVKLSRRLPGFCFSCVLHMVPERGRWDPPIGRSAFRLAVKLTGALFHFRGFWEGPEEAAHLFQQLQVRVPILCFHRIVPKGLGNSAWTLEEDQFECCIRQLADKGYQTISLSDLRDWQSRLSALPAKPIVLTFDDGHEGFISRIAPILRKYKFGATIFIIAGKLGKEVHLGGPPFRVMGPEEVQALAGMGFHIEGHGVNHEDWTRVSLSSVQAEVAGSFRMIREITGHPARFFAYPYGKWTPAVRDLLKSEGCAGACTTEPGDNGFGQDPFLLKRRLVLPTNIAGARVWALNHLRSGFRQDTSSPEAPGTSAF
jgi:peptidoglycan/xylan/chitin deacetylase (PgdA/CDA1 family)/GT2 family glycosyltransferase